ncbi:MoaF-related domain-containing protein [Streptomyces rubrogriseus]|uniref:MoaF-like domain-containing protein n=1 Tax=Streptomyces rubrogriseus TaxID=194673 RepID=A0A6G3TKY0_9ACTN|nr:hypothetical protein [Streptomyces rubrogriseus]NEC37377.1 hypothetical protein [Streptomyces rubrogriseus]
MAYRQNGRRYLAFLGTLAFEMCCVDDRTMTIRFVGDGGLLPNGHAATVAVRVAKMRPGVFLTAWRCAPDVRVVHLEDFERGRLHLHVTRPGSPPDTYLGTLTELNGCSVGAVAHLASPGG